MWWTCLLLPQLKKKHEREQVGAELLGYFITENSELYSDTKSTQIEVRDAYAAWILQA
jgi:hypothetical protein